MLYQRPTSGVRSPITLRDPIGETDYIALMTDGLMELTRDIEDFEARFGETITPAQQQRLDGMRATLRRWKSEAAALADNS